MPPKAVRRRAAPEVMRKATLPPMTAGIKSTLTANEMPPNAAFRKWNLIAAENGDRVRLGSREWCTGLTGLADDIVRTVLPFAGATSNGLGNRLFATTSTGIWDVSASSAAPSQVIAFGTQTGDAGYGVCHAFVTTAGHFLIYCDEENGLYVYTENTDTWAKVNQGTTVAWTAATAYLVGDRVYNGSNVYECITAGTSAGSGGPILMVADETDGSAHWEYIEARDTAAIGPNLTDQRLGVTVDPATFCFVTVFKSRLWFLQKNTARAWYMDAGALYGTPAKFDLGSKFRAGGDARGLWNWTYDGGSGMDDSLVVISSGGDVVIYQGTDPASANTFGLKGVWYVGALPAGRSICTNFGGDLLVLARVGIMPLSRLVVSGLLEDGQYATADIQPIFNALMLSRATFRGWSMRIQPEDNAFIVTVPTFDGAPTTQLVMSLSNKSWSQYRDLPIFSCESWDGKFYYGTVDGKVGINDGYVDGRTLADPDAYSVVQFAALGAFSDMGSPAQKQVMLIRPTFQADSAQPSYNCEARYDYDLTEIASVDPIQLAGASLWGSAIWGEAIWGGEFAPSKAVFGAAGVGVDVAIAIRGSAVARTVLLKFDVGYQVGNFL